MLEKGAGHPHSDRIKPLFDAYQAQGTAEPWNIHVSDWVASPSTRRTVGRGHRKM
jgi:hypothetical protein